MNQKDKDYPIDYKYLTLKLVDGTILEGKVNISPHKRVSDFINSDEKSFMIVVDGESQTNIPKTFFLNKSEVTWLEPEES